MRRRRHTKTEKAWIAAFKQAQGRPPIVMPDTLGIAGAGISFAQAGAGISALSCPTRHRNAVPVESGGETVAALCPDCDTQLPADWKPAVVTHDSIARDFNTLDRQLPSFVPDPRLTRRISE